MNLVPIAITRLRRDFNSVRRRLESGEVDAYIVNRRKTPIVILISYEKANQWREDLERIQELVGDLKQLYRGRLGGESSELAADSEDKA